MSRFAVSCALAFVATTSVALAEDPAPDAGRAREQAASICSGRIGFDRCLTEQLQLIAETLPESDPYYSYCLRLGTPNRACAITKKTRDEREREYAEAEAVRAAEAAAAAAQRAGAALPQSIDDPDERTRMRDEAAAICSGRAGSFDACIAAQLPLIAERLSESDPYYAYCRNLGTPNRACAAVKRMRDRREIEYAAQLVAEADAANRRAKADVERTAAARRSEASRSAECARQGFTGRRVQVGMTSDTVVRCGWGRPSTINRTITAKVTTEQWVYGVGQYLYFTEGRLTAIQDSR